MKNELDHTHGVVSEIEISYRPARMPSECPHIKYSDDVYKLFLDTWDHSKIEFVEQFKVMILNRANRVLGICTLTTGSTTNTVADPKQVFAIALKANCSEVIIAHNHPSGNLLPSAADHALTKKMKEGGELLDIKLLDHLIVSSEGFYSFATEGTL